MTGFVYFLRCGDFVKIGYSASPKGRLRALRTSMPFDCEIVGIHSGTKNHEQQLHRIFSHLRHRNEWFRLDESIVEIAKTGLPYMEVAATGYAQNALSIYLTKHKITQIEFARALGVTQQAVCNWLSGARTPRPAQMLKILKATDGLITPNDFLSPEPKEAAQ